MYRIFGCTPLRVCYGGRFIYRHRRICSKCSDTCLPIDNPYGGKKNNDLNFLRSLFYILGNDKSALKKHSYKPSDAFTASTFSSAAAFTAS